MRLPRGGTKTQKDRLGPDAASFDRIRPRISRTLRKPYRKARFPATLERLGRRFDVATLCRSVRDHYTPLALAPGIERSMLRDVARMAAESGRRMGPRGLGHRRATQLAEISSVLDRPHLETSNRVEIEPRSTPGPPQNRSELSPHRDPKATDRPPG